MKSNASIELWRKLFSPLYVGQLKATDKAALSLYERVSTSYKDTGVFVYVMSHDDEEVEYGLRVYHQDEPEGGGFLKHADLLQFHLLEKFIVEESTPLMARITSDNYKLYIDDGYGSNRQHLLWFIGTSEDYQSHSEELNYVAKLFRNDRRVLFVWLSAEVHKEMAWSELVVSLLVTSFLMVLGFFRSFTSIC